MEAPLRRLSSLLVCLSLAVLGATAEIDGIRIINGTAAPVGKYPGQVSLRDSGGHFCGGSILSADYVLTAAHCFNANAVASNFVVVSNVTDLRSGGSVHPVVSIITHEDWYTLRADDIALLKVSPPFDLASGVEEEVTLPRACDRVSAGQIATVIGWGYTSSTQEILSDVLMEVDVPVLSDADCEARYINSTNVIYPERHICAGDGPWDIKDSCQGDSGGPLFVDGVQVGIVSFGDPPCSSSPGVYTEIANYIGWIVAHAV